MEVPFQKQIVESLIASGLKAIDDKVGSLDLDKDGKKDVEEVKLHVKVVLDKCGDALHEGANLQGILAGVNSISIGINTILKSVDQEKLKASLLESWGSIQEILKLAMLLYGLVAPKAAAPVAPPKPEPKAKK